MLKRQMNILELKSRVSGIKMSLNRLNSRKELTEELVNMKVEQ